MSLFTHPHVVPNLYEFLSSAKHKEDILKNVGDLIIACPHWLPKYGETIWLPIIFFGWIIPLKHFTLCLTLFKGIVHPKMKIDFLSVLRNISVFCWRSVDSNVVWFPLFFQRGLKAALTLKCGAKGVQCYYSMVLELCGKLFSKRQWIIN